MPGQGVVAQGVVAMPIGIEGVGRWHVPIEQPPAEDEALPAGQTIQPEPAAEMDPVPDGWEAMP